MEILIAVALFMAVLGLIVGASMLHRKHRHKLRHITMTEQWRQIIEKNVPLYLHLPEELQRQLEGHVMVFLDEKEFEGCQGIEITDEIKVTIAAQACMLLLNREPTYYPKLDTILVYPRAYIARGVSRMGNQFVHEQESARLGESWLNGSVILAWDHVKMQVGDFRDGHNVVLHEFAHQLDQEDGAGDGVPILEQHSQYMAWSRVLGHDYTELCEKVEKHKPDIIDDYGATNPAEFFAVATETFFEKPRQLKEKHPQLYDELAEYYKLDPVEWGISGE
ncbi:MAG: zinc-dependent peptidase [Victivallaceae bacterium]|nr:zinc-dependent peptidase [Victivallaceae bacterium]